MKFNHTKKWYTDNPEAILENETHKLLWDFEIQTDHPISARRPNLIIITKKKKKKKKERICWIVDSAVPADPRIKRKECKKRDKYLNLGRELKKTVEHESNDYTNCNWCSWHSHQRISTKIRGLGNNGTGGDSPN